MLDVLFKQLDTLPEQFPGMKALSREAVYLMGCRSIQQFCCSIRAFSDPSTFCPFCEHELARRGREPIAHVRGEWLVLKNEFPHKNVAQMWLIVPKRHIVDMNELCEQDWLDIGRAFKMCQELTGITSGGLMFRFGDPRMNVGTIPHLHINVIEPICGKEYRPPFAKNTDEHAEDYARMLGFYNDLRLRGGTVFLFSPHGIKMTQPAA